MGKVARKKKGRPSKADLARRAGNFRNRPETPPLEAETDLRRSRRRRNPAYHEDFLNIDDDEDDEDERRDKKLKLVWKLPHKVGFGGVDSSPSLSRTEVNLAHASAPQSRAAASSTEYGEGHKPFKKRRIDGDDGGYDGGGGDDDDDDAQSIGSGDRKEERRRSTDSKGMDSSPGTPSGSPLGLPLPDRKSLELILDKLQKKDTYGVYAEPVDPEELPDYHDVIEHPMDFGTIRRKLVNGAYFNLEQIENDVFLICTNAMQYNAPETIYFKQACSIQELARKKFQRLRIDIERNETELKSVQKIKSNSVMKKTIKKPSCRTLPEPVGSDFSCATLATTGNAGICSNVMQAAGCERPNYVDRLVDANPFLIDNKPEKTEEQLLVKEFPSKFGRTSFVLDENRRATYYASNQPVVRMESIFTTFQGENKQLVAVGLHADHSYARSLARFAATLGPAAWKVASHRIEQALPAGFKFGRGWVGEYEPLPTPVLMLENHTQSQLAYHTDLNWTAELRKDDITTEGLKATQDDAKIGIRTLNSSRMTAFSKTPDPAKVDPIGRPTLEEKLFGVAGTNPIIDTTCQMEKTSTIAKFDNNVLKQVELNCSPAIGNLREIASQKQFDYSSAITTSTLLDMVSRNRDVVQSFPFMKREINGVTTGGFSTGKPVTSSLGGNRVSSLSPDFVSNQQARAMTYFSHESQEQGLSDPVQLMRMVLEKTQNQQKSSNHPTIDTPQVMPSVPSSRRDDSSSAAFVATSAWMSTGAANLKLMDSSSTPEKQIPAVSLYNPTQELHTPVSQFCEEPPGSGGLQLQSEKIKFPPQTFFSQPIRAAAEAWFQNNRPMVFPQLVKTDASRFQLQSPWQGLIPQTQPKQKQEILPPDLNIGFQSSGSPVRQSSGILVKSQQPDLALQL